MTRTFLPRVDHLFSSSSLICACSLVPYHIISVIVLGRLPFTYTLFRPLHYLAVLSPTPFPPSPYRAQDLDWPISNFFRISTNQTREGELIDKASVVRANGTAPASSRCRASFSRPSFPFPFPVQRRRRRAGRRARSACRNESQSRGRRCQGAFLKSVFFPCLHADEPMRRAFRSRSSLLACRCARRTRLSWLPRTSCSSRISTKPWSSSSASVQRYAAVIYEGMSEGICLLLALIVLLMRKAC